MTIYSSYPTRAQKSGKFAEEFCTKHFGIEENDLYEIKSSCWGNSRAIIRVCQIISNLDRQYVVCRYRRAKRKLSRGPRKGQWVYDETIAKAYKKKIDIFVAKAVDIFKMIRDNNLTLKSTKFEKDGKWAPYWDVPLHLFPQHILDETEDYTLHGNPLDPPRWMGGHACIIENEEEEECPF